MNESYRAMTPRCRLNKSALVGLALVIVFGAAFGLRIAVLHSKAVLTPDSVLYMNLALNIVENFCYSHSNVASGSCVPFWGAQPPGYPLFIGLVKLLGGGPLAVVWAQTGLFAIALTYAVWACYKWHKSLGILVATGAVLAFSPLTVGWSRWVLTETLATAGSLWVFGELFRSLAAGKLRLFSLSLAICFATLMRWDQIWLVVPAAGCAAYLGGFARAARESILMIFIALLPAIVMVLRAATLGLPLLPTMTWDPGLSEGATRFWQNAAVTQNATSGFLWQVWARRYPGIAERFDYTSIDPSMNTPQFRGLLWRIGRLRNGVALPSQIETELSQLALVNRGSGDRIEMAAKRFVAMWVHRDNVFSSGWARWADDKFSYVGSVTYPYRIVLLLVLLLSLIVAGGAQAVLVACLLSYLIFRTLFLVALTALEIRYLVPVFPVIELVSVVVLLTAFRRFAATSFSRTAKATERSSSAGRSKIG